MRTEFEIWEAAKKRLAIAKNEVHYAQDNLEMAKRELVGALVMAGRLDYLTIQVRRVLKHLECERKFEDRFASK